MSPDFFASVLGALLTVAAGALSALAKRDTTLRVLGALRKPHPDGPRQSVEPVTGLELRLQEVREALARQQRLASAFRWANTLLTFGQFVIGGVLASSFIQDTLSKQGIGVLGLLVLLSSLVRQHYRPEVQFVGASQRAAWLKSLLRKAEDEISFLVEGIAGAKPAHEIQRDLSRGLEESDELEISDLRSITNLDLPSKRNRLDGQNGAT